MEILLEANRFASGRAFRFGQSLEFAWLEAADLVLTRCPGATTAGTDGAAFAQLIAVLGAQHGPVPRSAEESSEPVCFYDNLICICWLFSKTA